MRGERGSAALGAALVALAVSAAIGAAVADVARTELVLAQNRRITAVALAAADACLAEVMARIPPGWDFADVLAGPDGVSGTADDGMLATPAGCSGGAVPAPGATATRTRIILRIEASAGGGQRAFDAVVARASEPAISTLLWLASLPAPGTITGGLVLDGVDGTPATPAWAGFAAPPPPDTLDAWAAAVPGLAVSGGTLPASSAASPPLAALAARLLGAPHGGAETLVPAGAPAPTLAYIAGDLTVSSALHGAGLLFVDGALDIRGGLDFTGVVVASGGVRVASGASLTVAGTLWIGSASTLAVDGTVALRADAAAVGAADGLLPLPRRAIVLGQRDRG